MIRRPVSWRRPVARLARWLTGHPTDPDDPYNQEEA